MAYYPALSEYFQVLGYRLFGFNTRGLRFFSALFWLCSAGIAALFAKKHQNALIRKERKKAMNIADYPDMSFFISDMHDHRNNRITGLPEGTAKKIYQANVKSGEALYYYSLGQLVANAYGRLTEWLAQRHAVFGNFMLRSILEAELLCRDFLFSFRTCLDHMEKHVKDHEKDDPKLLEIFKAGTSAAYDSHKEYGFTYHLRNCAQHCASIVFRIDGETNSSIICSKAKLLAGFDGWNKYDKDYFEECGDEINLFEVFSKAFEAFNQALVPLQQYVINRDNTAEDLFFLRDWGDTLSGFYNHNVNSFHVMLSKRRDGTPVFAEEEPPSDTEYTVWLIDWDMIYGLTDSITRTPK